MNSYRTGLYLRWYSEEYESTILYYLHFLCILGIPWLMGRTQNFSFVHTVLLMHDSAREHLHIFKI